MYVWNCRHLSAERAEWQAPYEDVLVTVMAALRLIGLKPPRNHIDTRRRSIPGKHSVFHGLSALREPVAISKSECRLRSLAALSDEKMVCTSGMHLCVLV